MEQKFLTVIADCPKRTAKRGQLCSYLRLSSGSTVPREENMLLAYTQVLKAPGSRGGFYVIFISLQKHTKILEKLYSQVYSREDGTPIQAFKHLLDGKAIDSENCFKYERHFKVSLEPTAQVPFNLWKTVPPAFIDHFITF